VGVAVPRDLRRGVVTGGLAMPLLGSWRDAPHAVGLPPTLKWNSKPRGSLRSTEPTSDTRRLRR
jgi:sugar phosphate permease